MRRRRKHVSRGLVMLATSLVLSVPITLKLLQWITGKSPETVPRIPPARKWFRMYRHGRSIKSRWLAGYGIGEGSAVWNELRGTNEAGSDLVPFPPSYAELEEIILWFLSSATPESIASLFASPEGQFMFRILVPCVVLYRDVPGRMLYRARHGDDEAFENLLLLDKSIVADPVLFRRWDDLINAPKPATRRRFREAMAGFPRNRFDAKSVRVAFAGLLSEVARRDGFNLTGPDIREWFGMFEVEGLTDQDMPGGEALTKAIQRQRNWPFSRQKDAEAGH